MRKTLIAFAVAAIIALAAAGPNKAEAHGSGWWIAGAVVGGFALAAIANDAYYHHPYYYAYDPYYYPYYPYYPYPYYPYYHRHYGYYHHHHYYRHHHRHYY